MFELLIEMSTTPFNLVLKAEQSTHKVRGQNRESNTERKVVKSGFCEARMGQKPVPVEWRKEECDTQEEQKGGGN